ncbi:haloacid dehalogenase-like hydrolase [Myxococcota bacterium]|jgi:phosphoserine phosphatase|nr:haloacid dehalogenase-like hydrolase [Myxococcota bacterium]
MTTPRRWKAAWTLAAGIALLVLPAGGCGTEGGWSREVSRRVGEVIRAHEDQVHVPEGNRAPPVAVFDLDNTLIWGDISFAFLEFQVRTGRYGFDPARAEDLLPAEAREAFARMAAAADEAAREAARQDAVYHVLRGYEELWASGCEVAACAYLVRLLRGLTPEQARQLGREALEFALEQPRCLRRHAPATGEWESIVEETGIRMRPDMGRMVRRLGNAGFEVFVVSASPKPAVEVVAERYGIAPDRVIAVTSEVAGGVLTDRVLEPVTYGPGKMAAIRQRIGRVPAVAFGDARTDFEMLVGAEAAVLVDRGDPILSGELRQRGVLIQPLFPGEGPLPACEAPEAAASPRP